MWINVSGRSNERLLTDGVVVFNDTDSDLKAVSSVIIDDLNSSHNRLYFFGYAEVVIENRTAVGSRYLTDGCFAVS